MKRLDGRLVSIYMVGVWLVNESLLRINVLVLWISGFKFWVLVRMCK